MSEENFNRLVSSELQGNSYLHSETVYSIRWAQNEIAQLRRKLEAAEDKLVKLTDENVTLESACILNKSTIFDLEVLIREAREQQSPVAAVPDGWKLVPTELTQAMLFAANGVSIIGGNVDGDTVFARLNSEEAKKLFLAFLESSPDCPPSPRITELDAREIALQFVKYWDSTLKDDDAYIVGSLDGWFENQAEGLDLLKKLNAKVMPAQQSPVAISKTENTTQSPVCDLLPHQYRVSPEVIDRWRKEFKVAYSVPEHLVLKRGKWFHKQDKWAELAEELNKLFGVWCKARESAVIAPNTVITEQDARKIATSAVINFMNTEADNSKKWFDSVGRNLLNKLNAEIK